MFKGYAAVSTASRVVRKLDGLSCESHKKTAREKSTMCHEKKFQLFHLVVIEILRGRQLHPELCPDPEDGQDDAHDGNEER